MCIKKADINYIRQGNLNKMYLLAGDIYHTRAYYLSTKHCSHNYYECLSSIEESFANAKLKEFDQLNALNDNTIQQIADYYQPKLLSSAIVQIASASKLTYKVSQLEELGRQLGLVLYFSNLLVCSNNRVCCLLEYRNGF
jgi:geranylgeranyl pyrophosphate synthase